MRWLEGAADRAEGRLDPAIDALGRALVELAEATGGIEDALSGMAFDPVTLEATEERLFALRALARKHDVLADDLPTLSADLSARLTALDAGEARMADLRRAAADAQARYDAAADALSSRAHGTPLRGWIRR